MTQCANVDTRGMYWAICLVLDDENLRRALVLLSSDISRKLRFQINVLCNQTFVTYLDMYNHRGTKCQISLHLQCLEPNPCLLLGGTVDGPLPTWSKLRLQFSRQETFTLLSSAFLM